MSNGGQLHRILLLYPPYADFTCPYHSLSYVAAPLRAAGYAVDVLDMNALWFRLVFRPDRIASWCEALERRIAEWDGRASLSVDEQIAMTGDISALAACRWLEPERVVAILQGPDFYNFKAYGWAQDQIRCFETLLDRIYGPYSFTKAFSVAPHEPHSGKLIEKAERCDALIEDLTAILQQRVGGRHYVFCGITAPYSANLVPAMALFKAVANIFPGLPRVAGGTAIADVYKYRRDAGTLINFSGHCDYFYVGEAENGVVQLADFLRGGVSEPPGQAVRLADERQNPGKHRYVALTDRDAAKGKFAPYDWLANPPVYDWIDWPLYLSPERRINYAPVRGCFWNKCTFCDYGLNEDGPTAPYRAMDVDVALKHLRNLAAAGIRHIYLATDAVPPAFLGKFADGLLALGLDISWSCQVFLTRNFTPELIARLERSGMAIASFGLESGSAAVLAKMGKGTERVDQVLHPVLAAFRNSSVGLQPLYFYGFPGETDADRQATVDLLLRYADLFSPLSRAGMFGLMAGSMIARSPEQYGLRDVHPVEGEDIIWELDFGTDAAEHISCAREAEPYNRQVPFSGRFERPWAGGVDTFHSQLFVERFGRGVFERMRGIEPETTPKPIELKSHFDLPEIIETALIATSIRAAGCDIRLPPEVSSLTSEVLIAARRGPSSRIYAVEFKAEKESSGNASNVP
jgi:anaerobic magnesium-protoporphyrin IX monomethyl ester cyclase